MIVTILLVVAVLFTAGMAMVGAGMDPEWAGKLAPMAAIVALLAALWGHDHFGVVGFLTAAALTAAVVYLPALFMGDRLAYFFSEE